jgi:hypothetical protein
VCVLVVCVCARRLCVSACVCVCVCVSVCVYVRSPPHFGAKPIAKDPKEELKSDEKSKRSRPRGVPEKVHGFMSVYVDFGSKLGANMEARIA